MTPVKDFYKANNSHIIEGHNYWKKRVLNKQELSYYFC